MSLSTAKPFVSPNKTRHETPPPHTGFGPSDQLSAEESSPQLERGRKRRRSSAAYNTTQLPSATLRGRGRRRSSSLNPDAAASLHRSASPDRNNNTDILPSKQKEASKKSLRSGRKDVEKPSSRLEVMPEHHHYHQHTQKKRRSQSPSRSRSVNHEGDPKPRRRQRTRSRSRSHGHGKENVEVVRGRRVFVSRVNESGGESEDEDIAVED